MSAETLNKATLTTVSEPSYWVCSRNHGKFPCGEKEIILQMSNREERIFTVRILAGSNLLFPRTYNDFVVEFLYGCFFFPILRVTGASLSSCNSNPNSIPDGKKEKATCGYGVFLQGNRHVLTPNLIPSKKKDVRRQPSCIN